MTPLLSILTAQEEAVLELFAADMSEEQVARRLGITRYTVRNHCANAYRKLGVSSRAAAVYQLAMMRQAGSRA